MSCGVKTKRGAGPFGATRMRRLCPAFAAAWALVVVLAGSVQAAETPETTTWQRGPWQDQDFFPVAVWLQNPDKAQQYRAAGINLYVGLWNGPTGKQLATLRRAGMPVICAQPRRALDRLDDSTIIGWMHQDEPDNAQSLGEGRGYGSPVPPEDVVKEYERMRAADPSRPVLLNLGQGVAWDGWHGRGVRTNHPEDYPRYVQGCDVASFDIYPVTHSHPSVSGHLEYVARGVERLVRWAGPERPVWNCIECTRINHPTHKPTPEQVRCEVWMALVHGSKGLIYFVHEWQPTFNESALLSDPTMLDAVTRINRRLAALAPVLNGPTMSGRVAVTSSDSEVPVAVMTKEHEGSVYVFAVGMEDRRTRAEFRVRGLDGSRTVTVLDEGRTLEARDGVFADDFAPWDVHLYQIAAGASR